MDPQLVSDQPGFASMLVPAQAIGEVPVENVVKRNYLSKLFSNPIGRLPYFIGISASSGLVWLLTEIPSFLLSNNFIFIPQITIVILIILFEVSLVMRRLRDLYMFRWLFFLAFIPVINVFMLGILFFKPGAKRISINVSKKNISYIFKEILALSDWKDEVVENNQTGLTV